MLTQLNKLKGQKSTIHKYCGLTHSLSAYIFYKATSVRMAVSKLNSRLLTFNGHDDDEYEDGDDTVSGISAKNL